MASVIISSITSSGTCCPCIRQLHPDPLSVATIPDRFPPSPVTPAPPVTCTDTLRRSLPIPVLRWPFPPPRRAPPPVAMANPSVSRARRSGARRRRRPRERTTSGTWAQGAECGIERDCVGSEKADNGEIGARRRWWRTTSKRRRARAGRRLETTAVGEEAAAEHGEEEGVGEVGVAGAGGGGGGEGEGVGLEEEMLLTVGCVFLTQYRWI